MSRPAGDGALRLFVGLRLATPAAAALGEVAAGARRALGERGIAASWAAPAGYHVTLAFLGWTRAETVEPLRDRLTRALAGQAAFALRTAGMGCFPGHAKAQVLWVGVDDREQKVAGLAARVSRAVGELGFPLERRAYHPHVTLARIRRPSDLSELVRTPSERLRSETWVDRVVLFDASRRTGNSAYEAAVEWPLEDASNAPRRQTRAVERVPHGSDPSGRAGGEPTPGDGPEEIDHGEQGERGDRR